MIFNFLPSQIMTAFRVHNEKWFTESSILNSIGEGHIVPSYKPLMYSMRIYIDKDICIYLYYIYNHIYIIYMYITLLYICLLKKSEQIFTKTWTINISLNNSIGSYWYFPLHTFYFVWIFYTIVYYPSNQKNKITQFPSEKRINAFDMFFLSWGRHHHLSLFPHRSSKFVNTLWPDFSYFICWVTAILVGLQTRTNICKMNASFIDDTLKILSLNDENTEGKNADLLCDFQRANFLLPQEVTPHIP